MFAVITDDFTGASEIAGIALQHGFRAVIETSARDCREADVLVLASDMRLLAPEDAADESARATRELLKLDPEFIYKKVDSVLRGNIGPELEAQMRVENKALALLVPANPSRQRTIANGVYFIDGIPLAESGFAPSHRLASPTSLVVDILISRGASNAISLSSHEPFGKTGIHVGNTANVDDVRRWAGRADRNLVPAGGADFFAAILASQPARERINGVEKHPYAFGRSLIVCGSNFPSSNSAVTQAMSRGVCVQAMPDDIYYSDVADPAAVASWAESVVQSLRDHETVIIAALQVPDQHSMDGAGIARVMADVALRAVEQRALNDLMIEGGATSSAVMSALSIESLRPSLSLAPGVTRMQVDGYPDLYVTMKPGSYRWPDKVWKVNN